jgi:hypothetical protein
MASTAGGKDRRSADTEKEVPEWTQNSPVTIL